MQQAELTGYGCYQEYRTRALLGAYAYISTGRKWALNNGPPPIIENKVLQLTTFTSASVGDAVKQLRS